MSSFQLLMVGLAVGVALVTFRKDIVAGLQKVRGVTGLNVKSSVAVTLVDELVNVTELRDKLAAEDADEESLSPTNEVCHEKVSFTGVLVADRAGAEVSKWRFASRRDAR
jgi:hypothetical protein